MEITGEKNLNMEKVVADLQAGKVLVYPTETVYGLGCDATNPEAVEKIFAIKKRQQEKSVLVIAADLNMMFDYIEWTPKLQELADKYWPGPLTVVVPVKFKNDLAPGVIGSDNTIAFRITNHPLAHSLSEKLGKPIVSTSANISATANPYEIDDVTKMFTQEVNQPDIIIDGGSLPHHSPSTVVKIDNGQINILRQGELIIR